MSAGKDQQKARSNKVTHGWEEAGGEFYQESFPTDLDNTVITRDPTAIATLLPSKQNRAGKYWSAFFLSFVSFFSQHFHPGSPGRSPASAHVHTTKCNKLTKQNDW